ncbi:MAG TPA: cytochrome c [Thermoanaerobaculia bacterium]|nr:cytochrome c [Thermoanaerobaculia bacterium]
MTRPSPPGPLSLLLLLGLGLTLSAPPAAHAGNLGAATALGTKFAGGLVDGDPQPVEITDNPRENFLYGSIGAENEAGLPFWVVVVLPRIFPEYLPGPGGYASLGLPWEEGKEFPAGFSKKTVIFPRVGFNCALCHSTQYRTSPEVTPVVVAAGGSNTADIQGLLDFFSKAANDPKFTAKNILAEIDGHYPLRWYQRLLYRLVIPIVKKRLVEQGRQFAWTATRPRWGPGRDAPMNLTKFNFLEMKVDDSVDHTDFPAIWHLAAREQVGRTFVEGKPVSSHTMLMNLDGATTSFRSVIIDSALGLGGRNTPFFNARIPQLLDWLRELRPPPYPLPIDKAKAARGESVFEAQCANCHASGRENRMGTVIPIAEVGTDAERLDTWRGSGAATKANEKVASMGIKRTPMIETGGYIAVQLDGLWLRGPYLHNGSVPTIFDLLSPAAERPKAFCRGYDVLEREKLGFISDQRIDPRCDEAYPPTKPGLWDRPGAPGRSDEWPQPRIWKYYVSERGNGNGGHEYGTQLSEQDKNDLIEYLKTL